MTVRIAIMIMLVCHPFVLCETAESNQQCVSGYVVQCIPGQFDDTSVSAYAAFIIKTRSKDEIPYMILLYSPSGFGFDAPDPKPDQYLPLEMFTDSSLKWLFKIRKPEASEEVFDCEYFQKGFKTGDPRIPEQATLIPIPGREHENVPNRKKLPCMIVTGWRKMPK